MSDDSAISYLLCVVAILAFLSGCFFISSSQYNIYNDGVEDASDFYKQYNDTSKDIDKDFWIDYGVYRYPNFYIEFKERFGVK